MLELSNYWDDFQARVNSTMDRLEVGKMPNLERLTVHLTECCNFHCEYCNMRFSHRQMDEELARRIAREYKAMGGKIIHFTGGEPTVVPYFEDICGYAKSLGLQVSSNTNAFKRVDVSNIDKLKASFDTANPAEFEKTVGSPGFATVVENMKYYSEQMSSKMLSITAVLNRKTYPHMLELAKFVHENFKVYNLYFSNYKGSNPEFAFTNAEIEDMFANYIPKVLAYFKEAGDQYSWKQLALYKPADFINSDCRFEENKTIPCYIQLSEMTIDTDGRCFNCSHLFRDGVKPEKVISVAERPLNECFEEIKRDLCGNYVCLSKKCLSGCNVNLIGFNRAVASGSHI